MKAQIQITTIIVTCLTSLFCFAEESSAPIFAKRAPIKIIRPGTGTLAFHNGNQVTAIPLIAADEETLRPAVQPRKEEKIADQIERGGPPAAFHGFLISALLASPRCELKIKKERISDENYTTQAEDFYITDFELKDQGDRTKPKLNHAYMLLLTFSENSVFDEGQCAANALAESYAGPESIVEYLERVFGKPVNSETFAAGL